MATIGPAHIDIVGWGNWKTTSGVTTPGRTQASTALTGGKFSAASWAVNNYITWDVPLVAGTWTVTLIHGKTTDAGILTASLDGVDLTGTSDAYAATAYNTVQQWTGVSVTTGGVKEFKVRADTKNASSSSYALPVQSITFTNTDNPTTSFTCTGPSRIDIIPFGFWGMSAGSTPSRTQNSLALNGGYITQAASQSNEIGWYVPLTAGTWALDIIAPTTSNAGILTVSVDGSTVGTADLYSASLIWNVATTITGVTVATSKMALLKFATPTKNASSSSYISFLSHVALRKTA